MSGTDLVRLAVTCPLDLAGLRDRALLLLSAEGSATHDELLGLEREQLRFVETGWSCNSSAGWQRR